MRERSRGCSGLEVFVGIYGNLCWERSIDPAQEEEGEEGEEEEGEELEKLVEIWAGDLGL